MWGTMNVWEVNCWLKPITTTHVFKVVVVNFYQEKFLAWEFDPEYDDIISEMWYHLKENNILDEDAKDLLHTITDRYVDLYLKRGT